MTLKKIIFYTGFLTLIACSATNKPRNQLGIQINPSLSTLTRSDFENGSGQKISLPQNYSQENYKKLVLRVDVETGRSACLKSQTCPALINFPNLSERMLAELAKLKRFKVVNRNTAQKGKQEELRYQASGLTRDKGQVEIGEELNADYGLTINLSFGVEEFRRSYKNFLYYTVLMTYQIQKFETGEIIESDTAEGRAKRTIIRLSSGEKIGGFNRDDEGSVNAAMIEASTHALKIIANKLGNKLSIGCQVTAIFGTNMSCNKGYQEGFMGKQMVTIYYNYNGIDFPIAVAEVSPGAHKTSGTIIAWNDNPDSYIQDAVQRIQNDPAFAKHNELFAVSLRMPLPPEWDNNYKD